jgi:F-type H+-transporting ATPase subunit a
MVPQAAHDAVAGTAAEAGHHGEGGLDIGAEIMHHIMDSPVFELPPVELPLVGTVDFSITKHVLMMWIASAILITLLLSVARRARGPVPGRTRSVFEVIALFIRDEVARPAIAGEDALRYTGFLLTTFCFILVVNLVGLIPGGATATGNISVTAALAFVAFVMIQWGGIRQYGLLTHVKNLVPHGLPLWLLPIMFVVEVLSMFIRPFALCIRLFANMMAGHVVILALISLIFILGVIAVPVSVAFTLFVMLLEILVAFLQAYIFTVLTANFIGLAVHPAH